MYRWLWSRVGGRPWTFIIVDAADRHPLPFLLVAFGIGVTVAYLVPWHTLRLAFPAMAFCILLGHLFWRTCYHTGGTK